MRKAQAYQVGSEEFAYLELDNGERYKVEIGDSRRPGLAAGAPSGEFVTFFGMRGKA